MSTFISYKYGKNSYIEAQQGLCCYQVCYYKYKAASPYSCKAGLDLIHPKAKRHLRMRFQKAMCGPFTLEKQEAYHVKMML